MTYALVHYPAIDIHAIQRFRQRHDPQYNLIAPHITVLFPVPDRLGEQALVGHIQQVLRGWQPFEIGLQGVQLSTDQYIYLLVQAGREPLLRLHDEIYTGVVREYLRVDLPYIPHVTLGLANQVQCILDEAMQLGIQARCRLDNLHLVKVNNERTKIVSSRVFSLAR